MSDYIKFVSDKQKMFWLEEQLRLLWEFLELEGMDEEADKYVKEQQYERFFKD